MARWRRCGLAAAALLLPALLPALPVAAPTASAASLFETHVFVNENPNGANAVVAYSVTASGRMTIIGTYSTGGTGSDASFVASERADLAVDMLGTAGYLYALNLGDSTVSIFQVNGFTGTLTLKAVTPLNANAIAVNPAGTVLYAGGSTNEGSTNHLSSYLIHPDGTFSATPVATVTADVDGMTVSPDGTQVATAYPGTSPTPAGVQLFSTDAQGDLAANPELPEPCTTDVRFSPTGTTLYSAACSPGGLSSYSIHSGQLTQTASYTPISAQTLAVAQDGTVYFESSSGLQGAKVSGGSFTFGPATTYPANQTITSLTLSPDGTQLFVGSFGSSNVNDYAVGPGGSLTLVSQLPVMAGLPTVVAMTATCPGEPSPTGATCVDTQNLQVTIDPGTLTITTPYTATNPFVLPALSLSSDGTYLSSSATFPAATNPASQQIVVTSTLAADPGWTLSVAATNLTDGTGGTIASAGLGLTNGALINTGTFPGTVTFTNLPAHNPSPVDTDHNTGLGPSPQTWATTPAGDGTAVMDGTLTLLAPTTTPPGTYSGTITFSVV